MTDEHKALVEALEHSTADAPNRYRRLLVKAARAIRELSAEIERLKPQGKEVW